MGLPHSLVRQQLRLPLRAGDFDLKAAGGSSHHAPPARNIDFSLTMTSLTSSYLSSAARCHEALAASPACLRPLSQLQYTGKVLFHTPISSDTRLASLWRQLAIDMRKFDDPSYSTTQHNSTSPPQHYQRHTDTAPRCHGNTYISTSLRTVLCGRSTSSPRPHAQSPLLSLIHI